MVSSAITIQHDIILNAVRTTARGEWKVVVLDSGSRRLVDNAVKEDDILKENVTNIEQIEDRRPMNQEMDAVYILSALPHIVDCLMADFDRRRYRRAFITWTSLLPPNERSRIEQSRMAMDQIAVMKILNVDFFPRESHVITFRDPWSFPTLFHPACNHLVRKHLDDLAQKVVSVCVSLGEYPTIRYHNPQNASHEAGVLCSHLARFVQMELDQYAKYHNDFPPPSPRPRGALIITDRAMDLFAPLLHEFTYQAMVHDLLPLIEGDKIMYKNATSEDGGTAATKNAELSEKDSIWVNNRHLHMKDVLDKLASEFRAFKAKNPQFAGSDNPSSLNNIKDMLAGLPEYQEGKEAFSLHLNMASDAMAVFQKRKLAEIASVEQCLATGLDEDYKRAKNVADQVVRLLDEGDVVSSDRLRLIMQYVLYRDGLLPSDTQKLLAHAQLPGQDAEVIQNLDLLGAHSSRALKDPRPLAQPPFGRSQAPANPSQEDSGLSRFNPALKVMLEEHIKGTLDQQSFPFTKAPDAAEGLANQDMVSQSSLRSAKPTWARTRPSTLEPRQRIIVFMAGGATYSESRACYEISQQYNKDVFLTTSHMLTPSLFLRQAGDLSVDRRRLNLPAEMPKPKAPAHLFERELPPQPRPHQPASTGQPLSSAMGQMNINSTSQSTSNGNAKPSPRPAPSLRPQEPSQPQIHTTIKLNKDQDREKEKKKHRFFGSKK